MGAAALLPSSMSRDDSYLAPARYHFAISVPIWVQGGSAEVLIDTYQAFVSGRQGVEGNRVEFHQVANAPHNILFVGHFLGWKAQAEEATEAAGRFLKSIGIGAEKE